MRRLTILVASALAVSASAATIDLRLPADGATLRGGSFASIDWSARQLPPAAEEWEGFLSVDGGGYYAFRITPHLDIALRRFVWVVPNVDAADARILIRVGDERTETAFELPGSFSIVRDPRAGVPSPALVTPGRPESAREGDPEVIGWASGDRSGECVTQVTGRARTRAAMSRQLVAPVAPAMPAIAPQVHGTAETSLEQSGETLPLAFRKHRAVAVPWTPDILLSCCRLTI